MARADYLVGAFLCGLGAYSLQLASALDHDRALEVREAKGQAYPTLNTTVLRALTVQCKKVKGEDVQSPRGICDTEPGLSVMLSRAEDRALAESYGFTGGALAVSLMMIFMTVQGLRQEKPLADDEDDNADSRFDKSTVPAPDSDRLIV